MPAAAAEQHIVCGQEDGQSMFPWWFVRGTALWYNECPGTSKVHTVISGTHAVNEPEEAIPAEQLNHLQQPGTVDTPALPILRLGVELHLEDVDIFSTFEPLRNFLRCSLPVPGGARQRYPIMLR